MGDRQAYRTSLEQPRGSRFVPGAQGWEPPCDTGTKWGSQPPIGLRAFPFAQREKGKRERGKGRSYQVTEAPTKEERTKTHRALSRTQRRGVVSPPELLHRRGDHPRPLGGEG